MEQVKLWKGFLEYERSNPQRLDATALTQRVELAYMQALMCLLHVPEVSGCRQCDECHCSCADKWVPVTLCQLGPVICICIQTCSMCNVCWSSQAFVGCGAVLRCCAITSSQGQQHLLTCCCSLAHCPLPLPTPSQVWTLMVLLHCPKMCLPIAWLSPAPS